jgi:hypothetical protein
MGALAKLGSEPVNGLMAALANSDVAAALANLDLQNALAKPALAAAMASQDFAVYVDPVNGRK